MIEMSSRITKKKAFTLIELVVVIAIVGVLVLLATPMFLGYTKDAKLVQITNDVKAYEAAIEVELVVAEMISSDKFEEWDWQTVELDEMREYASEGSLFDKKGYVRGLKEDEFFKIQEEHVSVNSKLKGEFIYAKGGEVYYQEKGMEGAAPEVPEYTVTFIGGNGETVSEIVVQEGASIIAPEVPEKHDGKHFEGWDKSLINIQSDLTVRALYMTRHYTVTFQHEDGEHIGSQQVPEGGTAKTPEIPRERNGLYFRKWSASFANVMEDLTVVAKYTESTDEDFGMSSDFRWVKKSGSEQVDKDGVSGYFRYIGTGRSVVEVPHVIQGAPVTSYHRMFEADKNVKKVVSTNTNITDMSYMFMNTEVNSLDLSSLNTSNVTNMSEMFMYSGPISLDLSSFDTRKVTDMSRMFSYFKTETLDLSSFNTERVTDMNKMFSSTNATSLKLSSSFNTVNVKNMNQMFRDTSIPSLNLRSFDTSSVTDMSFMFESSETTEIIGLENFDTRNVTNMSRMFHSTRATELAGLENFDTRNVTDMSIMFRSSRATSLNLSSFDTSNVTDMNGMFKESNATTLDLKSFDTSNVTNMNGMFESSKATSVDLSSFDTRNVVNMSWMFAYSKMNVIDLSSFDTKNTTNVTAMFQRSTATTGLARTQVDADKFNDSVGKPIRLRFIENKLN